MLVGGGDAKVWLPRHAHYTSPHSPTWESTKECGRGAAGKNKGAPIRGKWITWFVTHGLIPTRTARTSTCTIVTSPLCRDVQPVPVRASVWVCVCVCACVCVCVGGCVYACVWLCVCRQEDCTQVVTLVAWQIGSSRP